MNVCHLHQAPKNSMNGRQRQMLKRLWQWLKRVLQQWFGNPARESTGGNTVVESRVLTDTEYEALFLELLAGVNEGWTKGRVKGFLAVKYIREAELLPWLRCFGERLLASNASNTELAARMVQLGNLDIGEVGEVARNTGMQLLRRVEETNPIGAEEAEKKGEGEAKVTPELDKLLMMLQQDTGSVEQLAHWNTQGITQRYEEKVVYFDKVPEFTDAKARWFNKGNQQYKIGDFLGAIASYDKAIAIQPDDYQVWCNRGDTLSHLGRNEEAIASYDKALTIQPDFYLAWCNRGDTLRDLGRNEEAIASYDKALTIQPDFYQAWCNQGVVLSDLGRNEEAMAFYDKALTIQPDFYLAWCNRGIALSHLGRNEEAIESYDKALAIQPDFYQAWYNRGIAAQSSVSCDRFLSLMSSIVKQNPALNQRGYEGELVSYEEGLKHCPQDTHPEGWGQLNKVIGDTHYFQGHSVSHRHFYWRKAVNSYNQALKTLTEEDFPELHLKVLQKLIGVYLDLGYIDEAQELRRRGTDLLRRLLGDCQSLSKKKQLELKLAGF
ncbi:MAG: tetratricopeptide repeat protein [Rhizonema sp. PD38]|nr:tetratricopeptide repeat protein [Rhizonema sp. PD38]